MPGEVCKYIYFITHGSARSYFVDSKGTEHIYQIRLDNNWISDLESFFSRRQIRNIISKPWKIPKCFGISFDRLEELYHEVPKIERYFRILFQKAYINSLERLNATMWETHKIGTTIY